jgi:vacuolar-type H+-ATPase subunit I/STV1
MTDPVTGEPVKWVHASLKSLQQMASGVLARIETLGGGLARSKPEDWITIWYQLPGKEQSEAFPIDPFTEFVRRPYGEGVYYVKAGKNGEKITYFQCVAVGHGREPSESAGSLAMLRQVETQEYSISQLNERVDKLTRENTDIRAERNDVEDRYRETKRRVAELESALESSKANESPLFAPESMIHILKVVESWASGGSGTVALGKLIGQTVALVSSISQNPRIMVEIMNHHRPEWDAFQGFFNDIARESGHTAELLGSGKIKRLLAEAGVQVSQTRVSRKRAEANGH